MLLLVAVTMQLVPEGTAAWAWAGFGLALVTGALGAVAQTRLSTMPGDDPKAAQRFVIGLVVPFGLHVVAAVVSVLGLSWSGVKFEAVAAFALTFAAVVTMVHTASALTVGRALRARGRLHVAG